MESASMLADCKELPTFQMLYSDPMDETYKRYLFNPPHYFVPNAMYMVTGAILHNQHFLNEDRKSNFFWKLYSIVQNCLAGKYQPGQSWTAIITLSVKLRKMPVLYQNSPGRYIRSQQFNSISGTRQLAGRFGSIIGIPVWLMKKHTLPGYIMWIWIRLSMDLSKTLGTIPSVVTFGLSSRLIVTWRSRY